MIPAAQLKQAGTYVWQQQNRRVTEMDDDFSDNDILYCVGESKAKPFQCSTKQTTWISQEKETSKTGA